MTVRLCVIGNSHLAALVLGWRTLAPRYPNIAITFFGARASDLEGLRVSDVGLRPDRPVLGKILRRLTGGPEEIVARDYDAFWFAGQEFGLNPVLDLYARCWAEGHAPDPERTPVSEALFAELCDAALRRTLAMELYRRLRQVTDAPVAMLRQPAPSARVLQGTTAAGEPYRLAERLGDGPELARQADAAFARIAAADAVDVLDQPPQTRARPLLTGEEYARGSVRLHGGMTQAHGPNDVMHMNAEFGALTLDAHLPALLARSHDRALA